jgi:DNA-binding Lrp family transcriptional regulator
MAAMDDTDRLIVEALRADGRMSMRALADLVHISRASAYARVARLERDGVITGYAALVDPVRYGYALSAYVYLDIAQRSWKSVRGQLLSMPEVDHIALLSGEHDILLRVRARDAVSLRDVVLTRLQEIPEVRSTQTVLIFEELTPGHDAGAPPSYLPAPPLRHAQDLLECLHVSHRVVDGIVVMGCSPEPLPALRVAPVLVEAGPEVANAPAGVTEWIVHSRPIEHAGYPLPVVGGIVTDKDRPTVADVLFEPGRKALGNFLIHRYSLADDGDRRVIRVRRRVEQPSVERVTRVVVNGAELSQHATHRTRAPCLTVDEYPWGLLVHSYRIISRSASRPTGVFKAPGTGRARSTRASSTIARALISCS